MADWPVPSAVATAALVFVLVERGRLGEARRALDAFERSAHDPEAPPSQPLRSGRAYLLAAEGKPQAALEALRECERFERDWQARAGLWVAWRSQAALCQLALGDQSEARRLADEELALARAFGAQRAIGVALHAHALAHDADQATLTEAIEKLADSGARLEHARATIDLGSAIRRTGKRADARATLAEGADLAHRCGATALVDHARESCDSRAPARAASPRPAATRSPPPSSASPTSPPKATPTNRSPKPSSSPCAPSRCTSQTATENSTSKAASNSRPHCAATEQPPRRAGRQD